LSSFTGGRIKAPLVRAAGVKNCPAPSPVFTGCEHHVSQIETCLLGSPYERRVCVVHGLGGAGKTQIALRAIERTKEIWTDIIFVDVTSRGTMISALEGFAKAKKIGGSYEDTVRWLESQRQAWLLVLDNADDPSLDISSFIPRGSHGSILITTRLRNMALLAQGPNSACFVSAMDPQEALELLLKKARLHDQPVSEDELKVAAELVKVCLCDPIVFLRLINRWFLGIWISGTCYCTRRRVHLVLEQ
jgi:hypothetical protein